MGFNPMAGAAGGISGGGGGNREHGFPVVCRQRSGCASGCSGGPGWLQGTLFLVISAVLLALLRPIVRRYISPRITATNVDSVIGSTGLVTAAIDNVSAAGQVKLGAMEWTARSTSGQPIPVGTLVKVDRIEGVKAFVSPAEVPANV